jgi:hypothetical protein
MWSGASSTRPVAIRNVMSADPGSTGGVGVATGMGISVELWAQAGLDRIALPPAKALASKNRRRVNRSSSSALIANYECSKRLGKPTDSVRKILRKDAKLKRRPDNSQQDHKGHKVEPTIQFPPGAYYLRSICSFAAIIVFSLRLSVSFLLCRRSRRVHLSFVIRTSLGEYEESFRHRRRGQEQWDQSLDQSRMSQNRVAKRRIRQSSHHRYLYRS